MPSTVPESPPLAEPAPPEHRKASEAELLAIEDAYDEYASWADVQGVPSSAGLHLAYAGLNDLGVTRQGLLGGVPW